MSSKTWPATDSVSAPPVLLPKANSAEVIEARLASM
jgi:hypothetical protein